MHHFKNNKILLTVGDYESYETAAIESAARYDPQNINSYYGKILSIDLNTKNIDIVSMGHRNPQGLFYDFKKDIIFSTDHGPEGGDEINIIYEDINRKHFRPNKILNNIYINTNKINRAYKTP